MMSHNEKLYELRKYSRSIGGPEPTLPMLEFLQDNVRDMDINTRLMFEDVMNGFRKLFLG